MGQKRMRVKLDELGNVVVETSGFQGSGCQEATRGLEAALGGPVLADEPTAEMYDQVQDLTEQL